MKVFWLKKYAEERILQMYRGFMESYSNSNVKINDEVPFNYLAVINPKDSNCIYTLHNIHFKIEDANIVRLLSSDDIRETSASTEITSLQVTHRLVLQPGENLTELATVKASESLLDNNYIILLPGGSLVIETDKNINTADLSIDWSIESL